MNTGGVRVDVKGFDVQRRVTSTGLIEISVFDVPVVPADRLYDSPNCSMFFQ